MTLPRRRLRRAIGAFVSLAAIMLAAHPGQARPFTARDLVMLDRASDLQPSPNGRMLVFTLRRTDLAANRGIESVARLDLTQPGAKPALLQATVKGASMPRWSADGRTVYFLSDRSGSTQLWRVPATGGPATEVTHLPLDIGSYRLSPDGAHVVVSMAVFPGAESPQATAARVAAHKADGRIYDRLFVRHWDAWADGRRNHLFALALDPSGLAVGAPRPLMPGFDGDVPSRPFGDDKDFAISPDGRSLFFSARLAGRSEPWSTNFDIYRVPMDAAGPPSDLTGGNPAWDASPVVSPDGTQLAYRATTRPGFEADRFGVVVMDLKSGMAREIDAGWDRSADTLAWSQDGRTLYVTAADTGQTRLFAMDAATGQVTGLTSDGHVDAVTLAGDSILYLRDALDSPAQLWRLPASGGAAVQLTHLDSDRLAGVTMAKAEPFSFAGWNNETVHGIVVRPVGIKPGHKYPVVFLIHGGPQGSFGNEWSWRWNPQFYAGRGYAAVMIDFHGSTGYGQAFTDSISGHWGDRPLEDLQKGWAYALLNYDFLDANRACALGASYGGFMVNWIAGNWNAPWKCLVTHDGVFDDRMMGYATEELWFAEWEHGGPGHTPWSDPAAYEHFNPANHVAAWSKPQLIIHGARDYRIPVEQGLAAFDALQRRGIESRLLIFPDENHWVLKPADSLLWHETVESWLHDHLDR
jgi:dipeptidyl aminopeptidase/acylaminoacyl peptidase